MVRKPRIMIAGGWYHVYNRISSGETLFADSKEAAIFRDILRAIKKRDGWSVIAWCLMSNHYHLVLRTSLVPLWRGMHGAQNTFSRQFNRRHDRTGPLWQSRYKAKYVEDQSYLSRLVLYVHLNPVRGGITSDPERYRFVGHHEVTRNLRSSLVDVDEMLMCFGETSRAARRSYNRAVRAGAATESPDWAGLRHELEIDRPLGGGQDARSIYRQRPQLEVAEFVGSLCSIAGFDPSRLASSARDSSTAHARRVLATLGVERWGQSRSGLAHVLNKNPDVVSFWAGEGARRRQEDSSFREMLEDLDERLSAWLTSDDEAAPTPTEDLGF